MGYLEIESSKNSHWNHGREEKLMEIERDGWESARDSFNKKYPPGVCFTGTVDALSFAHGQYAALLEKMDRRIA